MREVVRKGEGAQRDGRKREGKEGSIKCWTALALLILAFANSSLAQTDGDRAIQLEQQRLRELEKQREARERSHTNLPAPATTDEGPAPGTGPCFTINTVDLEGVTLFPIKKIESFYRDRIGQCLDIGTINQIVKNITRLYIDAGYVTSRAYVPQQNLREGALQLRVVEGFIEAFFITGGADRLLATAFPGMVGKPLNLRAIEQGLDQLNGAAGKAKIEFHPGEQIGGTRVEIIYVEREQYSLNLSVDNSGQENTGEHKATVAVGWNNPLRLNDSLHINVQPKINRDEKDNSSQSFSFHYSIPYGHWEASINHAQFEYLTHVYGSATEFDTHGDSTTTAVTVNRLVHRNQTSKYFVELNVKEQQTQNYIDDIKLHTSSRTYRAAALQLSAERYFANGATLVSSLGYTQGIGADQEIDNDGTGLPEENFSKVTLSFDWFGYAELLGRNWNLRSTLSGQQSGDVLYSSEALSIGSLYTVRGFKETGLSGNSGAYWRNEIATSVAANKSGSVYFLPYLGLDYGMIEQSDSLSGATVGTRIKSRNFYLDVGVSTAIDVPAVLERENTLTSFSLTFNRAW